MTKQEAINYLNKLPDGTEVDVIVVMNPPYVSAGYIIKNCNVSRQLLNYYVKQGYIRTIPHGKQKRYLLSDIERLR